MSHPVFGALIARQLEQMWRLLSKPSVFHAVEAGSGDGALARSIVHACLGTYPEFAQALCYVAADYAPRWLHASEHAGGWSSHAGYAPRANEQAALANVRRVQAEAVQPFGNIVVCIVSNELLDNFPVHRFAIQDGTVREIFVTSSADRFTEVLDEPSTPRLAERLERLRLSGIVPPDTRAVTTGRKVFFRRRKLRTAVEMRLPDGHLVCSGTLSGMGVLQ